MTNRSILYEIVAYEHYGDGGDGDDDGASWFFAASLGTLTAALYFSQ